MKQEPMPNLKKNTIYYISTNIGAINNVYMHIIIKIKKNTLTELHKKT